MKLVEVIEEFISGDWGNETCSAETPNVVYCIRGADIVPISKNDYKDIPQRYVVDKTTKSKLLRPGDIVIEKSGGSPTQSTGRVVFISEELIQEKGDIVCSNFCTAFRVKDGWNPYFVYQYWNFIYNAGVFFNFEGKTSGIKNLQLENALSAIEIEHYDLDTQNRISNILLNIENKIRVNRALNDNLEKMAKQLYDYWFVQFDFPNEEGKPYKSSGGAMVWNERLKREIPVGWEICHLSSYLNAFAEKVSSKEVDKNCKYAPIEVLPRNRMCFNECAPIENAISGLCRFKKKNILLSNRRVYFHKVCISPFDGITRDTVIVLKPLSEELLGYTYQLVNDDVFIEYATRHSYGSEQPVLSWESAKVYRTIKPINDIDLKYSKIVNPMIEAVIKNELEIAELTRQRDELLPLLMNGQATLNYHLSDD